jgi:predicted membrane protein
VIGLLYLFNVVGFREMLSDQQYTVILVGVLAVATLLAAIQMDFMLVLFALFLDFCTYVYFAPSDNAALTAVGGVFRIADPQTNAATVTAVLAAAGFIASLIILYMMPRSGSSGQAPVATPTETSTD